MPVFGTKSPEDRRALHQKIRGPPKEDIEEAVRESLGLKAKARYVETASARAESITTPCVVFLILGEFEVGGQNCSVAYTGYTITDEEIIQLGAYSAVVVIPLS